MSYLDRLRQFKLIEAQQQPLRASVIDQTHPGSLLRDLATFLAFVDEVAPQVTGTHLLPLKVLEPLNARLSEPLRHGLSRPQQKSFPHINGLFWLARATGLTTIDGTSKKPRLLLDATTMASWQTLNPTEQYCTLLESWTLRAPSSIIGERDAFGWNRVVEYWDMFFQRVPDEGLAVAGNTDLEQSLSYFPAYHNLALLELFGLIYVQQGAAVAGKGWRIQRVQRTPLGDALLILMRAFVYGDPKDRQADNSFFGGTLFARYGRASEVPIGVLQPILQPYFPAWQHNLVLAGTDFQDGFYIFKVALGKTLWRRIAIPGQAFLEELSDAILAAYEFDHDHLYQFIYINRFGGEDEVHHPYLEEPPFTTEVRVGDLPLRPGGTMIYHYDFGDDWRFVVTLEQIDPAPARQKKAKVLEKAGAAPDQYPTWDEGED